MWDIYPFLGHHVLLLPFIPLKHPAVGFLGMHLALTETLPLGRYD